MRLRLGLLRDTAAIEKQVAKEAAEAKAKKLKLEAPTVKTEAQTKADEAAKEKGKTTAESKAATAPKARIRPLSEAKAIDSGANFISEAFLFVVGASVILFESWRSRRKETTRRLDVAEKLGELEQSETSARRALLELEKEVLRLRAKDEKEPTSPTKRILPKELWDVEEKKEKEAEEFCQYRSPSAFEGREKGQANVEHQAPKKSSSSTGIDSARPTAQMHTTASSSPLVVPAPVEGPSTTSKKRQS
ncbi:MAG: hypothetical protein M1830_006600 [Pleopsidium flavum]|nr:MAG: hypothetical protein M1830_006600 [Pleopsidium flavum]